MAENLLELGAEIASNLPENKKEKRYLVKILNVLAISISFPLLGFLLFQIDFSNLIHGIGVSTLFIIFISFLISFFADKGKIRNYLYKRKINRLNGFLTFLISFLIISILIFQHIMPYTKKMQDRDEKIKQKKEEKAKLKKQKFNLDNVPKIRILH